MQGARPAGLPSGFTEWDHAYLSIEISGGFFSIEIFEKFVEVSVLAGGLLKEGQRVKDSQHEDLNATGIEPCVERCESASVMPEVPTPGTTYQDVYLK
jgi:hypothetical protein